MRNSRPAPSVHTAGRKVRRPHASAGPGRPDTKPPERPATPIERNLADLVKQLTLRDSQTLQSPTSNPAVIKIFATLQEPDYHNPWQMVLISYHFLLRNILNARKLSVALVSCDVTSLAVALYGYYPAA